MSEFCRLVREVVDALPAIFQPHMTNVVVDVEAEPSIALRRRMGLAPDDDLFGLFEGVSIAEQEYRESPPNRIVIFKHPIERACRNRDEIVYEVRRTVLHELAHQFGYSEEDLDDFEARPSPFDETEGGAKND
jgi:predicted Zn-dependent protease with MMP-like domain